MAEYQEVARQFKRMCDSRKFCDACIINKEKGPNTTCHRFMLEQPMKSEEIVMEWAEEHPSVTNRKTFKKTFGFDISDLFRLGISRDLQNWLEKEYEEPKEE